MTHDQSGDLGFLDKTFFEKGYHDKQLFFPDSIFFEDVDFSEIPDSTFIICFGDSFSKSRPYPFQQSMGEQFKTRIINVLYNLDYYPEDVAVAFLSNAPQNKMPQYLIVESVERECVPRLYNLDFVTPVSLVKLHEGKKNIGSAPKTKLDREISEYYKKKLGMNCYSVKSYLNRPMFSNKSGENVLLSYSGDTVHFSADYLSGAIKKLEKLHQLAKKRNVKLIYMIAPNKSTLYNPYCIDENNFFIVLNTKSQFDTLPYVYNPLRILRPLAEKGVKDIYYADDTHWTPTTAKIVGEGLANIILKQLTTNNSND